jgi:hypothetical protein
MRNLSCSGVAGKAPKVHESVLISGRDAWLIAIPFGLVLIVQFFRLDTLVAASRRPKQGARRFCGPDAVGEMVLSDPDGRAVRSHRGVNAPRLVPRANGTVVETRVESQGERSRQPVAH